MEVSNKDGEEDEEDWEDATSDEDEEIESDSEHGSEKKDTVKEKTTKSKDHSPVSPTSRSGPSSSPSPKEQRTPRPKVYIPPPSMAQESTEGGKPLSPFSPLDGHRPVTDWGEEMEMVSPRSSMGGESPLKPSSTESSPPQKKNQEEEHKEEEKKEEKKEEERETKSHTFVSTETTEPKLEDKTGERLVISDVIIHWSWCSWAGGGGWGQLA